MITNSKPVVVVTGFRPFGDRDVNASWEYVAKPIELEHGLIQKVQFKAMELKVKWGATYRLGNKKPLLGRDPLIYKPDIWIAFGEAGGSKQFEIELKADPKDFWTKEEFKQHFIKNGFSEKKAKKEGKKYGIPSNVQDKYPKEDKMWTNNLQMCAELARHLNGKGYLTVIDHNAGHFVCGQMLYTLLSTRTGHKKLSLFIHVPTEKDMEVAKLKSFGLEVFDYVVNTLYPKI